MHNSYRPFLKASEICWTFPTSFCHKRLCYKRATDGTFILSLLYKGSKSVVSKSKQKMALSAPHLSSNMSTGPLDIYEVNRS